MGDDVGKAIGTAHARPVIVLPGALIFNKAMNNSFTGDVIRQTCFAKDMIIHSRAIGRQFTENWSGALTAPDKGNNRSGTRLRPTTGFRLGGLGLTYTDGPVKITGGVR
ncbi:MAG: hypothetical protein AAF218_06900 [Pseudomonadota bacterium]